MRAITSLLALLSCYLCGGQTNTTYYGYNRAGVPEKVGYSETRPAPKMFSDYVPAIDPYVYGQLIMGKQKKYEANLQYVKRLVGEIGIVLNDIYQYDIYYWEVASETLSRYLDNIKGYDFSNTQTYNSVHNTLSSVKSALENDKKKIIEDYYRKKISKSINRTLSVVYDNNTKSKRTRYYSKARYCLFRSCFCKYVRPHTY